MKNAEILDPESVKEKRPVEHHDSFDVFDGAKADETRRTKFPKVESTRYRIISWNKSRSTGGGT